MAKDQDIEALKKRFFEGMSHVASTVNVVTTDGPAGRAGVTVSAMSSVSADTPRPTLLVCVHENSVAAKIILDNGKFCVNILSDHQNHISDVFAGRFKDQFPDKFDCSQWTQGELEVPRVVGGLVAFDCRITSTQKVGTHYVIFGEVQDIAIGTNGSALIYANRSYSYSQPIEYVPENGDDSEDPGDQLSIGCFHTFAPFIIPRVIKGLKDTGRTSPINIVEGDNRRIKDALLSGQVHLAFLYDYGLSDDIERTELTQLTPYVLLAEGHPLAAKDELQPSDLIDEPMISVAEESSRIRLESILRDAGVEPNVIFKSSSLEMTRGMVAQGLGFAIVMTKPASSTSYDGSKLVSRKLEAHTPPSSIVLANMKDAPLPGNVAEIMDGVQLN